MLCHVAADASTGSGWDDLREALKGGEDKVRAFYLAVGPDLIDDICAGIGKHGLVTPQHPRRHRKAGRQGPRLGAAR